MSQCVQLASVSWSNVTRHPLVSVTCHCQTLVDETMARPHRNFATFSGIDLLTGLGCPASSICFLSTYVACCKFDRSCKSLILRLPISECPDSLMPKQARAMTLARGIRANDGACSQVSNQSRPTTQQHSHPCLQHYTPLLVVAIVDIVIARSNGRSRRTRPY